MELVLFFSQHILHQYLFSITYNIDKYIVVGLNIRQGIKTKQVVLLNQPQLLFFCLLIYYFDQHFEILLNALMFDRL